MKKKKPRSDRFYGRLYAFFRHVFVWIARVRYGVKVKKPIVLDEPTLILCNHNTDTDFTVISTMFKSHIYVVCSQHVIDNGLGGAFLDKVFHPIAVYKGSMKTSQVLEMVRRLRNGNRVLLFPEGRLSHNGKTCPFDPGVAKIAKLAKCRLITVRLKGGFFKQPRWQLFQNKGKLFDYGIVGDYSAEYVTGADENELFSHIEEDLYTDAYVEQSKMMQPFTFKRGLEGIERYYTVCPACRQVGTLSSRKNTLSCSCGFTLTLSPYGFLEKDGKIWGTTQDLEKAQNNVLDKLMEKTEEEELFRDENVTLRQLGKKQKRALGQGVLRGFGNQLTLEEKTFPFSDLEGADILKGGSALVFTYQNIHYELYGNGVCMQKYAYLYEKKKTNRKAHS